MSDETFDGCIGMGWIAVDKCSAIIPEQQGHAPVKPPPFLYTTSSCIKRNEEADVADESRSTKSVETASRTHSRSAGARYAQKGRKGEKRRELPEARGKGTVKQPSQRTNYRYRKNRCESKELKNS